MKSAILLLRYIIFNKKKIVVLEMLVLGSKMFFFFLKRNVLLVPHSTSRLVCHIKEWKEAVTLASISQYFFMRQNINKCKILDHKQPFPTNFTNPTAL